MINDRKNKANLQARAQLLQALITLVEEKNLFSINIVELTQKANVSRMTFYRNYDSIEQVLTDHLQSVIEKYKEEDPYDITSEPFFGKNIIIRVLRFFKSQEAFIRCLFKCGMSSLFLNAIMNYEKEKWHIDNGSLTDLYQIQIFSGGLYNLYILWSQRDFHETPEQLADIVYDLYSVPQIHK